MAADILLIEDDRDQLRLMAYLLRAFGHRPLSVASVEEGLDAARNRTIDLVICDLMLGGLTGFDLAKHFKADARLNCVPLVAVTAWTTELVRKTALEAGFDGIIFKPLSPEEFVSQLQRFVTFDLVRGLPPPALPSPVPEKWGPVGQRGVTILVVDDREANRDLARSLLEQFGFTILTAAGVAEGLACARESLPSLILTDVHMGDGSGFDLVREIRGDAQLQRIPCLVSSASFLDHDRRADELGLNDTNFILWPIEPTLLARRIEACLNGHSQGFAAGP